jgi:hypothetical protein
MIVPNSHQPHAGNAQVRLNERKIVKTISLKKVSAVAVASLGFGLLSVVPAQAALTLVQDTTLTAIANATKLSGSTGLYCSVSLEGSDTGSTTCTGQTGGTVQLNYAAPGTGAYLVRVTNATILAYQSADVSADANLATDAALESLYNGLNFNDGVLLTGEVGDQIAIKLTSATAGTSSVTVQTVSATTGALTATDSASITWATSSSLDPSAGFSTSINDGDAANAAAFNATSDDTIIASGLTAGTQVALIKVTARDGNNNLLANGKTVTAAITGPGTAGGAAADEDTYANSSRYETVTLAGGTGLAFFAIYADGTAGKSTIQILAGSTVIATETVTFHGRPTKVTVTQNHRIGSINGEVLGQNAAAPTGADIDNTPAVTVAVTDALGLPVSGQTISAATSDATVMAAVSGTCTESSGAGAGDGYAGEGFYNCSVTSVANAAGSGKTATLTFRVPDGITSGVFVTAAPITYTLGRDPVKVTMKTDKATYAPGEKMTLTISGFGSDDKAAADDIYTTLISATGVAGLVSSGTLPTASVALVNGVKTYTLYAPLVGGTFSFTGTTGVDTGAGVGTAVSTSYQVTDGKAAIATQIDALNAKIVALNALIAKIMKKLGVK